MLGCLEMDVQSCIEKYIEMMDYVFDNPRKLIVNPMTSSQVQAIEAKGKDIGGDFAVTCHTEHSTGDGTHEED